jgi:hypothetical protein
MLRSLPYLLWPHWSTRPDRIISMFVASPKVPKASTVTCRCSGCYIAKLCQWKDGIKEYLHWQKIVLKMLDKMSAKATILCLPWLVFENRISVFVLHQNKYMNYCYCGHFSVIFMTKLCLQGVAW